MELLYDAEIHVKVAAIELVFKVLDLYIYGEDVLDDHPNLEQIKGDIRNQELLKDLLKDLTLEELVKWQKEASNSLDYII